MIAKLDRGGVVVPWDFSPLSRAGLDHAWDMTNDAKLIHVVHVATPLTGPDSGVLYSVAEKRKCRELQSRFRREIADDSKLHAVRFHVVYGYAGIEIARFADRYKAELIVVASREKRSISDILFGSTAKQVVAHARRPVLAVHVDKSITNRRSLPHASSGPSWMNKLGRKPDVARTG